MGLIRLTGYDFPGHRPAAFESIVSSAANAANGSKPALLDRIKRVGRRIEDYILGRTTDQWKTLEVLDAPDTRQVSDPEKQRALAAIEANRGAETTALARVDERSANKYRELADLCSPDAPAREALQKMLIDGRLTRERDRSEGRSMLFHLARLATQPLAPGLVRTDLLTNLVEELENPTKIAQKSMGTCVATTATILLTRQHPAEYARLIADLAAPAGTTRLSNGAELKRSSSWNNPNDGNRTPSVRLLQPTLMEYGNLFLHYDNERGVHTPSASPLWRKLKIRLPGGLEGIGSNRILEGLTGAKYHIIYLITRLNRESAWRRIEAACAKGHPVPVGILWGAGALPSGGHKVLLDRIAGGFVYYTNPWGKRERMALREFKANLIDANVPA